MSGQIRGRAAGFPRYPIWHDATTLGATTECQYLSFGHGRHTWWRSRRCVARVPFIPELHLCYPHMPPPRKESCI